MNWSYENLLYLCLLIFLFNIIFYLLNKFIIKKGLSLSEFNEAEKSKIKKFIWLLNLLINLGIIVYVLELDIHLFSYKKITISIVGILYVLILLTGLYLIDIFIIKSISYKYQKTHQGNYQPSSYKTIGTNIQWILYGLGIYILIDKLELDVNLISYNTINLKISTFIFIGIIFLIAKVLSWIITELFLFSYYAKKKVDEGSKFAINQLLKYIFYVIAIFISIENSGLKITALWGGGAALLVGFGMGLQQTFNDLISGIILLFERTVEVEDVVEIDGMVGTVKRIGLRTSIIETRDNITVVVPNSKLIVDNVINWSHYDKKIRYKLFVGVAYGSDTQKVKDLLLQTCADVNGILKKPTPRIRLKDFGDSSLDFEIVFWSKQFLGIEDIKSDMRFEIDQLFRKNNISIPFPQRDIWIKK